MSCSDVVQSRICHDEFSGTHRIPDCIFFNLLCNELLFVVCTIPFLTQKTYV